MVDLRFLHRATHFVPLSLFKSIASASSVDDLPTGITWIGEEGRTAIKDMPLVGRGRLSVQRVSEEAFKTVERMTEKGGWEIVEGGKRQGKGSGKGKRKAEEEDQVHGIDVKEEKQGRLTGKDSGKPSKATKRAKSDSGLAVAQQDEKSSEQPVRRSTRTKSQK
jgi:hypothetical protein